MLASRNKDLVLAIVQAWISPNNMYFDLRFLNNLPSDKCFLRALWQNKVLVQWESCCFFRFLLFNFRVSEINSFSFSRLARCFLISCNDSPGLSSLNWSTIREEEVPLRADDNQLPVFGLTSLPSPGEEKPFSVSLCITGLHNTAFFPSTPNYPSVTFEYPLRHWAFWSRQ